MPKEISQAQAQAYAQYEHARVAEEAAAEAGAVLAAEARVAQAPLRQEPKAWQLSSVPQPCPLAERMISKRSIMISMEDEIARKTYFILEELTTEKILNKLKDDMNNKIDPQDELAESKKKIKIEKDTFCQEKKVNSIQKDNIITIWRTTLYDNKKIRNIMYVKVVAEIKIEVKKKFLENNINLKNKNQVNNAKKIIEDIIKEMKIEIIKDYGFLIGL